MTKYNNINLLIGLCIALIGLMAISCEDYLDKVPEADITKEEVFSTFRSFQGFVEEMYHCIPDYTRSTWVADWHIGDEVVSTDVDWRLNVHFDNGNYWAWYDDAWGWNQSYFMASEGANTDTGDNDWTQKGLWPLSWYGIRKANVGLDNLDLLVEATQEEKDIIEGQLLFFRGFFHFQLMSHWGGLPYIDEMLGSETLALPRLSYRETALRAAEDLEAAAALLPANWDRTEAGRATSGNNDQRITKSTAYAYLGKNYLYAASPLMNRESTGSSSYDTELCQKAAEALHNCLYLSHTGEAFYQLIDSSSYHENFYTLNQEIPGYPEMLLGPRFYWQGFYDVSAALWMPNTLAGQMDGNMIAPTHSYIQNFGMANGLPLDHPQSGYDPTDPWSDRDPRFYQSVVYDGVRVIQGGDASHDEIRYANLHNTGNYRHNREQNINGSKTGYLYRKFFPVEGNPVDDIPNRLLLPGYLRLADVYYMYAEAVLFGYGSANDHHPSDNEYALTAADAVNTVRDRFGIPGVHADFLGSQEDFMSEIRRERAVELMGEANIRFCDLRRWLIHDNMKYREKTGINFDRGPDGKPINMEETIILTRVVEDRHNWLPLPQDQVTVYPDFGQNPGW